MQLSEMKEIEAQINEFEEYIQRQYTSKVKDYENKNNGYVAGATTMMRFHEISLFQI